MNCRPTWMSSGRSWRRAIGCGLNGSLRPLSIVVKAEGGRWQLIGWTNLEINPEGARLKSAGGSTPAPKGRGLTVRSPRSSITLSARWACTGSGRASGGCSLFVACQRVAEPTANRKPGSAREPGGVCHQASTRSRARPTTSPPGVCSHRRGSIAGRSSAPLLTTGATNGGLRRRTPYRAARQQVGCGRGL